MAIGTTIGGAAQGVGTALFEESTYDAHGQPVDRICFAGEHTGSERAGYADGAMLSGIREAKRLLQQSTVGLAASG